MAGGAVVVAAGGLASLFAVRVASLLVNTSAKGKALAKVLGDRPVVLIRGHGDALRLVAPRAGAIAYPRYAWRINSTELVTRLRDEQGVREPIRCSISIGRSMSSRRSKSIRRSKSRGSVMTHSPCLMCVNG